MKSTVIFVTLLSISWALKVTPEDPKDKREAPVGYPSGGHTSHSFQAPSFSHDGGNSVSIGAGYSVGGAKPSYIYEAPDSSSGLSAENLPASGHATIQLAPITLQPSHGNLVSNDLSQLMSQLSHGFNTGALSLSHYQADKHGPQEVGIPQFSIGEPKLQYAIAEQPISSVPSYAAGTKGLGSYSTGPVLFSPSDNGHQQQQQQPQQQYTFSAPSGHFFGDAGSLSLGGNSAGLSMGDAGHGLGGSAYSGYSLGEPAPSLGSSGYSFGAPTHSYGGQGISLGGSGISLGGSGHALSGSIKGIGSGYIPGKTSFKPSTFLGAHGDSSHGLFSLSGAYGSPSLGSHSGGHGLALSGGHGPALSGGHGPALSGGHGPALSGGHGPSHGPSPSYGGGSSKFIAHTYLPPKSKGGASLDSVAFSSSHQSPPRTTYGIPAGASFPGGSSSSSHAAPSHGPQYYVSSSKFPSFGDGSTSFKALSSGPSSLSSLGPKYSYGHSTSRFAAPKDTHGSYSENTYNTIKYSEELKPRAQH